MGQVSKSVLREIGAKKTRAFSSFHDYLKVLIADGTVTSSHDLVTRKPSLLGEILFQWYQQGQIACVFAQQLAKAATPAWGSVTIQGTVDPGQLETVLIDAAKNLDALQLVFPGPATAQQACDLIKELCVHPSWSCKELPWMEDEKGRSMQVGLRWHPEGTDYVSWVLGIAPFDTMPFTRRLIGSPFIALVIRSAPPAKFNPAKPEEGLRPSHLAHMNDMLGEDKEKRAKYDATTRKAKIALLGSELRSTARAKVTFALPLWCREVLGDVVTQIEEVPLPAEEPKV
jgi:hypothetical protein